MEARDLTRGRQSELDNLEKARRSLGQADKDLDEILIQQRRNFDTVFPTSLDTRKSSAKYLQMSLPLLQEQSCYRNWWQSNKGSLLLISGITVREGLKEPCGYSWLSPAASDLAVLLRSNKELVAFANCHPTFEVQPDKKPTVTDVVACLLFQILKLQPQILSTERERRFGNLQREAWSRPKPKDTLTAMLNPVLDVLQSISDQRWTYLIIDRADRCSKIKLQWLLEWLHKIVSNEGCRVKVLVVWDSKHSDMDEQDWQEFEETAKGHVFSKLGWYQERRAYNDKSPLRTPLVRLENNYRPHR